MPSESLLLHRFVRSLSDVAPTERSLTRAAVLLADHMMVRGEMESPAGAATEQAASAAIAAARLDRDDVHWASLVHPGAPVWAVAIAFAHQSPRPGPSAYGAAIAGYEAAVRLGNALEIVGVQGFHRTAVVAPTAVAVTRSSLRGEVDPDAVGHALSLAGGSAGAIRELSGTRAIHRGAAVLIGIAAFEGADAGFRSTQEDLERGGGAIPAITGAAAAALLTSADAIGTTSVRVFPTSGWNQTAYEAARDAATAAGRGRVISIRAVIPPSVILRSVDHDRWHNLAAALADAAGAETLADIQVVPGAGSAVTVTVAKADGSATASVDRPLDDPSRRAELADLGAKWRLTPAEADDWLAGLRDWLSGANSDPAPPPPPPPPPPPNDARSAL